MQVDKSQLKNKKKKKKKKKHNLCTEIRLT